MLKVPVLIVKLCQYKTKRSAQTWLGCFYSSLTIFYSSDFSIVNLDLDLDQKVENLPLSHMCNVFYYWPDKAPGLVLIDNVKSKLLHHIIIIAKLSRLLLLTHCCISNVTIKLQKNVTLQYFSNRNYPVCYPGNNLLLLSLLTLIALANYIIVNLWSHGPLKTD